MPDTENTPSRTPALSDDWRKDLDGPSPRRSGAWRLPLLVALGMAWELWLAPTGSRSLAFKVLPLIVPLAGVLKLLLASYRGPGPDLASLLAQRRVRSDMAMTGEISLRGRVLRVGGIKEKVLAAVRFGVKHVILPEQNRSDWLEVPAEVRKRINVHFVRHIAQVIRLALPAK